MNYKINLGSWNSVFAVPSAVVDKYILLASGPSVKVLLFLLRNCDRDISTDLICRELKMTEETVTDALTFWVQAGLLNEKENGLVPSENTGMGESVAFVAEVNNAHVNVKKVDKVKMGELSPSEIAERINGSPEIKALFVEVERIKAQPLTHTDHRTILRIHDYIGMHPDVILMLVRYCKSIDRCSMKYVERVAGTWIEEGITTHQQAEKKIASLKKRNKTAVKVKAAFGIERNLSAKENDYIDKWIFEYKMSFEMMESAYQIMCNNGVSKISFAYIDKILASWDLEGIRTANKIPEAGKLKKKNTEASYDLLDFEQRALTTTPKGVKND